MPPHSPLLGRVVTAMATPFQSDGTLDPDGADRLASHLVEHGTDTVLVCGTTGESPTLQADEQLELLAAVRSACGDRAKVLVGTGSNDTAKACRMTERATEAGANAVLVVTPYYNKPSQRGLREHFRAVAASTDLPVLLYDIPGRTARELTLGTLLDLAEVPNIVGVKDSAGDVAKTAELLAQAPNEFVVYCGADELNLPMLAVGAAGFVSVAAHVAGPELADLAGSFESDPAKAREIHLRLLPLFRALFLEPSPAPLKAILNDLGLPAGPVRPPLVNADGETLRALRAALDHAGIPH
ncbi:MAG: 4-hydroxy-tetrahydrodipicolinate synthase [Actinomycetota bacterium]|nr:4-hydroxy-tetrahydrodipicolinate synthase [Actinomycetota bacterium]